MKENQQQPTSEWQKTKYSNLIRNVAPGKTLRPIQGPGQVDSLGPQDGRPCGREAKAGRPFPGRAWYR